MEENFRGPTSAFATLTPLRPRQRLREWLILVGTSLTRGNEDRIQERTFLHHALWVNVPARKLRRAKPQKGREERTHSVLFISYFTDDLLDYLRGFTEKLAPEMDALWGQCTEWKGAASFGEAKRFVLNHRWRTDAYFNGRKDLNVGDTRVALATRLKLDELARLLDAREDPSGAAFKSAYVDAVNTAFGQGVRFEAERRGKR